MAGNGGKGWFHGLETTGNVRKNGHENEVESSPAKHRAVSIPEKDDLIPINFL